ncbi:MAG: ATP-binding cassette domain-containing protein [Aquificae bacterium]|nr:ATP-binding cassette domain-containing protein [Aquificota bacterium]
MIKLRFLKRFPGATVGGYFEFYEGFNVLLGPSGCGKTTTVRVACGLERPDEGFMECCGKTYFDLSKGLFLPPQKRRLGLVFQEPRLFPHMTVEQNVRFAFNKSGRRGGLEELLKAFGLWELKDRYPDELSGGQKQRVALARALAYGPKALFLDEPFSSLDFASKLELMQLIKERVRGLTVVFVTHDPFEALFLGEHFTLMRDGRPVERGGKEVVSRYVELEKLKEVLP